MGNSVLSFSRLADLPLALSQPKGRVSGLIPSPAFLRIGILYQGDIDSAGK
jgi:hypothetical protein